MPPRPLVLTTDQVRAVFAGRKTTHRVPVFPSHLWYAAGAGPKDFPSVGSFRPGRDGVLKAFLADYPGVAVGDAVCPHGHEGDRVWIQEPWYDAFRREGASSGVVFPGGPVPPLRGDANPGWSPKPRGRGWKCTTRMPRWASRLTVEVAAVRVRRLHPMTPAQALAEGAEPCVNAQVRARYGGVPPEVAGYAAGWNRTRAGTPYAWAQNPWVWVLTIAPAKEA